MSPRAQRSGVAMVLAAALVWHGFAVLGPAWTGATKAAGARDFASYYYAAQVAREGGDPYDRRVVAARAREDGRSGVHPFFYPPPFLAGTAWITAFDLGTAFRIWFWLDELAALLAAGALWRSWRGLDPAAGVAVAAVFALTTAIPNNHAMGQANLPVLALVLLGLHAERGGRQGIGGLLVGLACMAKMSPALFVGWWALRGRWRAVGAACAAALGASVAALPWVRPAEQLGFYTRILPGFASGDYNGLGVPIGLFGNHSVPNLLHLLLPSGGPALSPGARALGTLIALLLLGALAWATRRGGEGDLARAAQIGAIGVAMLLIPVYTYEHHMVWALPAAVVCALACAKGRFGPPVAVLCGLAIGLLAFDLQQLKVLSEWLGEGWAGALVRELKFGALGVLFAGCLALGSRAEA